MNKFSILSILVMLFFSVSSFTLAPTTGEKGIDFKDISFQEALKLAQKENKLIFVDAYTTWCGPCKMMDKITFKADNVATTFNANFINLQIDMEKGEGLTFARKYRVMAYPSMFLINGQGKVVKRMLGFMKEDQLLAQVKDHIK